MPAICDSPCEKMQWNKLAKYFLKFYRFHINFPCVSLLKDSCGWPLHCQGTAALCLVDRCTQCRNGRSVETPRKSRLNSSDSNGCKRQLLISPDKVVKYTCSRATWLALMCRQQPSKHILNSFQVYRWLPLNSFQHSNYEKKRENPPEIDGICH